MKEGISKMSYAMRPAGDVEQAKKESTNGFKRYVKNNPGEFDYKNMSSEDRKKKWDDIYDDELARYDAEDDSRRDWAKYKGRSQGDNEDYGQARSLSDK